MIHLVSSHRLDSIYCKCLLSKSRREDSRLNRPQVAASQKLLSNWFDRKRKTMNTNYKHDHFIEMIVPLLSWSESIRFDGWALASWKPTKKKLCIHRKFDGKSGRTPNSSSRSIHHHLLLLISCIQRNPAVAVVVVLFFLFRLRKAQRVRWKKTCAGIGTHTLRTGPDEIVI